MPSNVALPAKLQDALAKFTEWVNAHLTEQQNSDVVHEALYQYTNAAGIHGIFASEQLWFTDHRYLNDPSEFHHGLDLALDMVADAQSGGNDPRANLFLQSVSDFLSGEKLQTALGVFVACFSRERDDLGQWRAYGDNGRGFALGFSPRMFRIEESERQSPIEKIFLGSVVYETGHALARHRAAIDEAVGIFLETAIANQNVMTDRAIGLRFMRELTMSLVAAPLIWNSITAKHPAYAHEREVRQTIFGAGDSLSPHVKTRVRGSEIVPYVAAPWRVREPNMIAEIVIGPAAPPNAEESLLTMLNSFVVTGVELSRSDIPYRPA